MSKDYFLNLKTLYNHQDQRNIEYLNHVYYDLDLLEGAVNEVLGKKLTSEMVNGKHLLLKPNWVNHDRNLNDELCLRANNNLIISAIRVLLSFRPSKITIGDSPVQGCIWNKICPDSFLNELKRLSIENHIPIFILDFRRVIYDSVNNELSKEQNSISEYVIFDVGMKSFLEPISLDTRKLFRVAHYDYIRLAEKHLMGSHSYCITKKLFEADIVISIPKIKTHQKVGLTAALKNLVGLNGDKDYLPHHRIGGTKMGGDCYPGHNVFRSFSEQMLDISNKKIGTPYFKVWQKLALIFWDLSNPGILDQIGAGWYGNDTTWRMVLDLNQIVIYGKSDGTISDIPQRQLFSLCDGIIGGQDNGPLFPKPLRLGFLSFTNNAAINDYVFAYIMNLNPDKIALIINAFKIYENSFDNISLNGQLIGLQDLKGHIVDTIPPPGWVTYLKE